jgi:hypothetical protein
MKLRVPKFLVPAVLIFAGLAACYPVDDDAIEDYDLAITVYDKEYYSPTSGLNKFQEFSTFYMTDTIAHVIEEGKEDDISRKYDEQIIQQVAMNMKEAGYTEVFDLESADLYMTIAYTKTTFENYNFYFSGGGWYYPWSSYGMYTTSYDTGSLLMEMIEVSRIDPDELEIPALWAGVVQGIIEETKSNNMDRLTNSIDQCFVQSPYLNKSLN